MEEKKKLEALPKEEEKNITISFDEYQRLQVENVKLKDSLQDAIQRMRAMNDALIEKRMGFLFEVVKNPIEFDDEFVAFCKNEIQEALSPVEEKEKKEEKKENE